MIFFSIISLFIPHVTSFLCNKILYSKFVMSDDNGDIANAVLLIFGFKYKYDYNIYPCLIYSKNNNFSINKIKIALSLEETIGHSCHFSILKKNKFTKKKFFKISSFCEEIIKGYFYNSEKNLNIKCNLFYNKKTINLKFSSRGLNEFIYDLDDVDFHNVKCNFKGFDFIFKYKFEITENLIKNKKLHIKMFSDQFYYINFSENDKKFIRIIL